MPLAQAHTSFQTKRQTRASNERGFAPHKEAQLYAKQYKGAVFIKDDSTCLAVALANSKCQWMNQNNGGRQHPNQKQKFPKEFNEELGKILRFNNYPVDFDDLEGYK